MHCNYLEQISAADVLRRRLAKLIVGAALILFVPVRGRDLHPDRVTRRLVEADGTIHEYRPRVWRGGNRS